MSDGLQSKKFPELPSCSNSRGPTYNFQEFSGGFGGAIYIKGGTLVIHDSAFDTKTAGVVSESVLVVSRTFLNFPDFLLYVRGRHMQLSRAEQFMCRMQTSRSTPAFSRATLLETYVILALFRSNRSI